MAISAKDVMALRARTGVGMMECKKALAEADGDSAKAIEILREKLKGKMDERTDRAAGEGALAIAKGDGAVALIELKAESDFTARNDAFVDAAQKIADIVLAGPEGETTTPTAEATELIDNLRITTKENISFARGIKLARESSLADDRWIEWEEATLSPLVQDLLASDATFPVDSEEEAPAAPLALLDDFSLLYGNLE